MRIAPMLAIDGPLPTGPGWVGEPKMDGWRALVRVRGGTVTAWSRHGTNLTDRFPELAALAAGPDVVLDGELVVYGTDGLPDFHALGTRQGRRRPAVLVAFDVLAEGGRSLTDLALAERRACLERLELPAAVEVVVQGPVDTMWTATQDLGMEGVVAKRLDSPYRPGRSRAWVRRKHWRVTTLRVRGYAAGAQGGIEALLVAGPDPAAPPVRVELGLGRFLAARLPDPLPRTRERDGVVWIDPELEVVVRHHGPAHQPRDATFLAVAGPATEPAVRTR